MMRTLLCFMALTIAAPAAAQSGGRLLSATPAAGAPAGTQAWRISYRTSDETGRAETATAMVVAPRGGERDRPVLAWTHGTWGVSDKCAPSASASFFQGTAALPGAVERGYVVVAPDYTGLGGPGEHGYMVGNRVARSVIDAVRAAREVRGAGSGRRFAVWGESEGGHAALFTGFNARSYAPELTLTGIAAAAPPTDLVANLSEGKNKAVRAFLTAFVLHSWSRHYGTPLTGLVRPRTARLIDRLAVNNCVSLDAKPRVGTVLGVAALSGQLRGVDLGASEPWAGYARRNSAPVRRPDAPLLIYQSDADVIVSAAVTRDYARKLCRSGVGLNYISSPDGKHEYSARDSATRTLDWIDARFAGRPPGSDCGQV